MWLGLDGMGTLRSDLGIARRGQAVTVLDYHQWGLGFFSCAPWGVTIGWFLCLFGIFVFLQEEEEGDLISILAKELWQPMENIQRAKSQSQGNVS